MLLFSYATQIKERIKKGISEAKTTFSYWSSREDPFLITRTNSAGLGARFNADQCMSCHSQPAIGGSGGFLVPNPQAPPNQRRPPENPMFDLIPHRFGMRNYVPSFLTRFGPIREVRSQRKPDGTPDGGVHQLF